MDTSELYREIESLLQQERELSKQRMELEHKLRQISAEELLQDRIDDPDYNLYRVREKYVWTILAKSDEDAIALCANGLNGWTEDYEAEEVTDADKEDLLDELNLNKHFYS